jgi:hypothetical protein
MGIVDVRGIGEFQSVSIGIGHGTREWLCCFGNRGVPSIWKIGDLPKLWVHNIATIWGQEWGVG